MITFKINLESNNEIVVCCVYRSPNSSIDNSENMNLYLKSLSDKHPSNFIVMGDFNYPKIDWKHYSTTTSINDIHYNFLETVRDCSISNKK